MYRIKFAQPLDWDEVCCFDMGEISSRSNDDLSKLYMLSRESVSTDVLQAFHRQSQILNRHVIAELLQSDALLGSLRKEFKRLFDMKSSVEELRGILVTDVMKRDTLDGDGATAAKAAIKKAAQTLARKSVKAATIDAASASTVQARSD